ALTIPFVFEPKDDLKGLLPTENMHDEEAREQAYHKYTLAFAKALLNTPSSDGSSSLLDALNSGATKPAALRGQYRLAGGSDGALPSASNYEGEPEQFQDFLNDPLQSPKNGLLAFESVEDISIVAAPGYSANPIADEVFAIESAVITHCERMR